MTAIDYVGIARRHALAMRGRVAWVDVDEAEGHALLAIARAIRAYGDRCDTGLVVRAAWCGVRDYVGREYRARRAVMEAMAAPRAHASSMDGAIDARDALLSAYSRDPDLVISLADGCLLRDVAAARGVSTATAMRMRDRLAMEVQS